MGNEATTLTIFADYSQFYLQDERSEATLAEIWDERSVADLIAVGPGVVAVGTARNYYVPVAVRTLDESPEEDLNRWDHVAEVSLSVPSGCLLIYGPTEWPNVARMALEPGHYVVRVYYEHLESVSQNGLEGDDSYEAALWPGPEKVPQVLKRSEWSLKRL
jgi:hypothetical protein